MRKITTVALLPLASLAAGAWPDVIWWVNVVTMTIAVVLTIASGIDYVVTEVRGSRRDRRRAV